MIQYNTIYLYLRRPTSATSGACVAWHVRSGELACGADRARAARLAKARSPARRSCVRRGRRLPPRRAAWGIYRSAHPARTPAPTTRRGGGLQPRRARAARTRLESSERCTGEKRARSVHINIQSKRNTSQGVHAEAQQLTSRRRDQHVHRALNRFAQRLATRREEPLRE